MLLYNLKLLALPYFIFLQLNTKPTPTVVELFTSEGCSSCPPADRLLTSAQSSFGNEIIVLSYHVDYWDRLGWKDPFSKAIFSERQRAYSRKLNPESVYTPQAIVNGQAQFVGSDKKLLWNAISNYKSIDDKVVQLTIDKSNNGSINFEYNFDGLKKNEVVLIELILANATVAVKRGENSGSILNHTNIVQNILSKNTSKGRDSFLIPPNNANEKYSIVAFVQNIETLAINHAVQIPLPIN